MKILIPLFNQEIFLDRMIRLTKSIIDYDIRENLNNIKTNTLIVASTLDYLTPLSMQEELNTKIQNSKLVILPNTGHAAMYENKEMFLSLILGFIDL